jgi:hypothetical protein
MRLRYLVYSDSCDYADLIGLQKYSAKSVSMALQSSGGKSSVWAQIAAFLQSRLATKVPGAKGPKRPRDARYRSQVSASDRFDA